MWYSCSEEGNLKPKQNIENLVVNIDNYLATMREPEIQKINSNIFYSLSSERLEELRKV